MTTSAKTSSRQRRNGEKHLRDWKRAFWKGERKAARRVAAQEAATG
jgi:hypothetical protein